MWLQPLKVLQYNRDSFKNQGYAELSPNHVQIMFESQIVPPSVLEWMCQPLVWCLDPNDTRSSYCWFPDVVCATLQFSLPRSSDQPLCLEQDRQERSSESMSCEGLFICSVRATPFLLHHLRLFTRPSGYLPCYLLPHCYVVAHCVPRWWA